MAASLKQFYASLFLSLVLMASLGSTLGQDDEVHDFEQESQDEFPPKSHTSGLALGAPSRADVKAMMKEQTRSHKELESGVERGAANEAGPAKPFELAKLIFNPFELVKAVALAFKLPVEKLIETLGGAVIFGVEAIFTPVIVSLKILEKVFVPDACKLRFLCKIGNNLTFFKEAVLKFTPTFIEGSGLVVKSLTDGIVGRDCEIAFPGCGVAGEPKLKPKFEQLR